VWLGQVLAALLTTVFGCGAIIGISAFRSYKLPVGIDDAVALFGIFFAALISTFVYMPTIQRPVPPDGQPRAVFRTFLGSLVLSSIVAIASSVGGGIIRRWIVGVEPTVLSQPMSLWWDAMFFGWLIAFCLCLMKLNLYHCSRATKFIFDKVDAWIMGIFAVAGAMASLKWHPAGDYSNIAFIQVLQAVAFAALTGAGGGLVAKLFIRLTLSYAGLRSLTRDVADCLVARYTNIGAGVGLFSYLFFRAFTALLQTRSVTAAAFDASSVSASAFYSDLLHPSNIAQTKWAADLVSTDLGLISLLYLFFGFASCYMYRNST
jgi:hypothetical protein